MHTIEYGNFITIKKNWENFKKLIDSTIKKLPFQYEEENDTYEIFALDDKIVYICNIFKDGYEPRGATQEEINENTMWRTDFETNFKSRGNIQLIKYDPDFNPITIPQQRAGTKYNAISFNFCDKTTWYYASTPANEILTDSGDGLTFNSTHTYWIDLTHGKVTFEDDIIFNNNKWYVAITSDSVAMIEDVDYTVNYVNGTVTFASSQSGKTIEATYWYAGSSLFVVRPPVGKKLELTRVEVQFSSDIQLNDTMTFNVYGYAGVFAPQYVPVPYSALDVIPLGRPLKYKNGKDYLNESNGTYPVIPPFGGTSRGIQSSSITFPWTYLTKTQLLYSAGMQVMISMQNHTPHGGEFATVTLYCVVDDE